MMYRYGLYAIVIHSGVKADGGHYFVYARDSSGDLSVNDNKAYVSLCICIYVYVCMYVCMYVYVCVCMYVCVCIYVYVCMMYVCMYACMCMQQCS